MDSRQQLLAKVPVARILIPFIAGILLFSLTQSVWAIVAIMVAAIAAYAAIRVAMRTASPMVALRVRGLHITYIALLGCALGWTSASVHEPVTIDTGTLNRNIVIGRIDHIEFTDFSMSMHVELQCTPSGSSKATEIGHHPTIALSVKGCDYRMILGDLVAFRSSLDSVRNMGNPDEMDYAGYLRRQGIVYRQHLTSTDSLRVVGHAPTLMNKLGNYRIWLQRRIIASSLPLEVQNFVIALVLGDGRFIDQETRHEFSNAGVAHILALSGLHVGIVVMILWWILLPLDYLHLKSLRLALTLILLMAVDAFTGMSASMVRATIMTAFVSAAMIMHRKTLAINALASAALLILAFNPSAIYDAGFQLSFVTVGAILIFGRQLTNVNRRRKVAYLIYSSAMVSAIATASTITLCAHYFHTISLSGIIANMVILPTFPFFMTLCVLFTMLCAMGGESGLLNWLLGTYYDLMRRFIEIVNGIPLSHIDNVWVTDAAVWGSFGIMACLAIWVACRNKRWLVGAALVFAATLMHSAYSDFTTPREGLVLFNSFDSTPIVWFNSGKAVVWVPDNEEFDIDGFTRSNAGFLAHYRIESISMRDSLNTHGSFIKDPFAYLMGYRIMEIGRGKWRHMVKRGDTHIDIAIITKRFHSDIAIVDTLYDIEKYVLSGDIYGHKPDSIKSRLHQIGKPYHCLRDGAVAYLR